MKNRWITAGTMTFMSALCLAGAATAGTIARTSFESEAVGSIYTDTGDAASDHVLVNNVGEAVVGSTVTTELGYNASYVNTRGDVGLTDGDYVGVTDYASGVGGSFTDGSKGYEMSDTDGQMLLTFDSVDVSGHSDVLVSLDLFVQETGWETGTSLDSIIITALTDVGDVTLLDTSASDIDDLGIEGYWMNLSAGIDDSASTISLVVAFDSNSGSEAIYLDNVSFESIPEPAALTLIALGGSAVLLLRRRLTV